MPSNRKSKLNASVNFLALFRSVHRFCWSFVLDHIPSRKKEYLNKNILFIVQIIIEFSIRAVVQSYSSTHSNTLQHNNGKKTFLSSFLSITQSLNETMSIFQHPLLLVFFSFLVCPVASQTGQKVKEVNSGLCTGAELIGTAADCQAAATVWAGGNSGD